MTNKEILTFATLFEDEITLDKISREVIQLYNKHESDNSTNIIIISNLWQCTITCMEILPQPSSGYLPIT